VVGRERYDAGEWHRANGRSERPFEATILKGIRELRASEARRGGRKSTKARRGTEAIEDRDPDITRLLEDVMDESTVGDPMSPLKWNSKSTYQIQQHLASQGHRISEDTIQRRLRKLDYSLQANRKDKRRIAR